MTVNTSGGSRLYIGSTATFNDQAGYETESWLEVGEIENLGEFGDESSLITFTALKDGRTRKFKGPRDAGTMVIVVGSDSSDAGQAAMLTAEADDVFDYNFKVEENDELTVSGTPTTSYFRGKVTSRRKSINDIQNVVRKTFNVAINSAIIEVSPT